MEINTNKAESEIKKLKDSGLIFEYEFSDDITNKLMVCIDIEDYSIKDIVSKLKDGEVLQFYLNDGLSYDEVQNYHLDIEREGSIYWASEFGECIRVDSSQGSLQQWAMGLLEKYK